MGKLYHSDIYVVERSGKQFLTALVIMLLYSADIAAAPHPEGGDGSGLIVRLELPWTTLMAGEKIQYHYILENVSDKSVPVAFPYADRGFGWLKGGQPFLEPIPRLFTPELDVRIAQWPPKTEIGEGIEAWGDLSPGQRIILNQNRLPSSSYGVSCTQYLKAMRAHWLVGPGRWISSELVSLKVLNAPRSTRKDVFEAKWSSYGYDKDLRKGYGYTALIEGKLFLFFNTTRMAEVEPDAEFTHAVDKYGTNLEVTIKNSKASRKLYYHLRHGLVGDTPWPIGPVKLFYPTPEPIPPAEIKVLRKQIQEQDRPAVIDRGADGKQRSKPNKGEQDGTYQTWFGIALFLATILILLLLYARRINLRKRASIKP